MTYAWMLYAIGVSLLLGLAAWALEGARLAGGRPLRWVWTGAMAASVLAPVAAWVLERLRPAPPVAVAVSALELHPLLLAASSAAAAAPPTLEERLLTGWALLSALLFAALVAGAWLLARRAAGWGRAVVEGAPVRIAPDTGPAVVGLLRPEVVLPAWSLSVEPAERALMLQHEQEHLRARDPQLLLGALLLVVAVPWNPVLWWQLRRLRQAVEMDCDSRVLRGVADVRRYGRVLLDVGERARRSPLVVASLSHPTSLLERRIRRMTSQPNRYTRLWSAAGSVLAVLCVAAACEAPRPNGAITPPEAPEPAKSAEAAYAGAVPVGEVPGYRPEIQNMRQVIRSLEDGYPENHRDQAARATVRFVIGTTGIPEGVYVIESAGVEEFDAAAVRAIQQARFNAPPKSVIATMPIMFQPPTREVPATASIVGNQMLVSGTAGKSSGSINTPEMIRMRELARKHTGEEGRATLSIMPDGSVSEVQIVQSTGDKALDEAFIAVWRPHRFPKSEQAHTISVPMVPHHSSH